MAEITRYNERGMDLFTQMRREMDSLFNNWFGRLPSTYLHTSSMPSLYTPVELQETDIEYVVKFDVPGLLEKDIKVSFQGDLLTISGERKEEKAEGKGATRYTERTYGSFMRTVSMPTPVKADDIRARYKNGVMEVHLPKAQKTATREIKVESAT